MSSDYRTWQRKCPHPESINPSTGMFVSHDGGGMTMTAPANPITDVSRMSASAIINTDAVDYEDEVIVASGVRISNYQHNPVVLWDHGKSITTLPIGTCRAPNGEIDLIRNDRTIESTTYFAKSLPFAYQVFGLIDEGVIRATSIHVVPSQIAEYRAPDGRKVMVTEESDLVEYSWTSLGVNPEAVRREKSLRLPDTYREAWTLQMDRAASVLNRGTLGGDTLSPSIRKSLMQLAKPRGMLINPFGESQDEDMTQKTLTGPELRKIGRSKVKSMKMDEYDEATQAKMKAMLEQDEEESEFEDVPATTDLKGKPKAKTPLFGDDPEYDEQMAKEYPPPKSKLKGKVPPQFVKGAEEEETDETEGDDEEVATEEFEEGDEEEIEETDAKSMPVEKVVPDSKNNLLDAASVVKPGAKVLKEAHDAVDYVVKYLQAALAPIENEAVVAGMTAELEALMTSVDAIRGLFAASYPDSPALGLEAEQTADNVVNEQIKSMLAARQRNQFRVLGLQSLVASVAESTNLTIGQKKSLLAVQSKFTGMLEEASNFTPEIPDGYVPLAQYEALESKFNQLDQLLTKAEQMMLPASSR